MEDVHRLVKLLRDLLNFLQNGFSFSAIQGFGQGIFHPHRHKL